MTSPWKMDRAPAPAYDSLPSGEDKPLLKKPHSVMRVFEGRRAWGCGSISITLIVFLFIFVLSMNAFLHTVYEETQDSLRDYYREQGFTKRQMALGPESDLIPDAARPLAYATQLIRRASEHAVGATLCTIVAFVAFCLDVGIAALSFSSPVFTMVFICTPLAAAIVIQLRIATSLAAYTMGMPYSVFMEIVRHHGLHASAPQIGAVTSGASATGLVLIALSIIILATASRARASD